MVLRRVVILLVLSCAYAARSSPCDFPCTGGRCTYANCVEPQCKGGACEFHDCTRPSCEGGACTFHRAVDPSCAGGSCFFWDVATTLRNGYCNGGGCVVQGQKWPIRLEGVLSY
ncbi:hypothetical protein M885DRAFT_476028 [Pelagophyceae sp. CCMP2097]|nr:hypothetical protein M885DRAFT_476028 [Pelagophyceae sp. CCMP2097]|mmetsp:Transcript_22621/g.76439  ORF Transcript_22621/g.76439 Transcript_22621/m.76439 type:complete len:114 (-) Transcript_22621:125-466(-)